MAVTKATIPAGQQLDGLTILNQIGEQGFLIFVKDLGAHGDLNDLASAMPTAAVFAHAALATLSLEMLLVAEVDKGVQIINSFKDDMTTTAAITAGGAAFGDIFLTPKRDGAMAAIARF